MARKDDPVIHPVLGISLGVLTASTSSILIRFAQQDAPSLVIAAYRLGLATLLLIPVLWLKRKKYPRLSPSELSLSLLSGLFLAAHFATWISSLEFTSVASSVVLVSTTPLFVALLAPRFLSEPLNRNLRVGLFLALMGSLIIGINDACSLNGCPPLRSFLDGETAKGDLLALAGAIAGAGYIVIGRKLRTRVQLLPYISLTYGMAAVLLILLTFFAGLSFTGYPRASYMWFILLALFPQLIAHSSINWALKFLPAALVSIILLGEPIGSILLALILLRESPSMLMIGGGIFILCGIIISSQQPKQNRGPDLR
jgi:drug/metabolite transporter (DMT)-like permease